ncbi:MAG: hypothetical protein HC837_16275 [Chloroflexaceae bacterium]|nr:hypothetical protein [Chloroflexaceae bacterium]
MSPEDSQSLIDTTAAAQLGVQSALFQNEEEGILEKFQPYAVPSESWLLWLETQLQTPREVRTLA